MVLSEHIIKGACLIWARMSRVTDIFTLWKVISKLDSGECGKRREEFSYGRYSMCTDLEQKWRTKKGMDHRDGLGSQREARSWRTYEAMLSIYLRLCLYSNGCQWTGELNDRYAPLQRKYFTWKKELTKIYACSSLFSLFILLFS